MHFINNFSVALVAALATTAQAERHLKQRQFHRHDGRGNGLPTVYSTVAPAASSSPSVPIPLGTATSSGYAGSATTDVTVTYTLGTGTSTSVVTTTIHHTATNEHTVWATETPAADADSQQGSGDEGETSAADDSQQGSGDEGETTITRHNAATVTATLYELPTGEAAGGKGQDCALASTVTVTATETVTINNGVTSVPTGAADEQSSSSSEAAYTESSSASDAPIPSATPSAPYGNGTLPISHSSSASGFATSSIIPSAAPTPSGTPSAFHPSFHRRFL